MGRKIYDGDKHTKYMTPQMNMTLEDKVLVEKIATEQKENMKFSSLCKSLAPSVVVGTLAAMGCQEFASKCDANPEIITLAGMTAQYIGGWVPFLGLHYQNNKHRLRNSDGSVDYHKFGQDIGAVLVSDQISNKIWAGSYILTNELALRSGVDPAHAGLISGISSGTIYTLFTSYVAPKVNAAINYVKDKIKRERKE